MLWGEYQYRIRKKNDWLKINELCLNIRRQRQCHFTHPKEKSLNQIFSQTSKKSVKNYNMWLLYCPLRTNI